MKNFILTIIVFLSTLSLSRPALAADNDFKIIVNPANPINIIDQKFLAEIYLKKKVYWPDMHAIFAVDLSASSNTRERFSEKVLDRPVSAVRSYWQQMLFSGRAVQPPELKTEQDVLSFVATHENAIGYVSSKMDLHDVRPLAIK
jgi:ABC-type phosphate transport system substrate-binding protein